MIFPSCFWRSAVTPHGLASSVLDLKALAYLATAPCRLCLPLACRYVPRELVVLNTFPSTVRCRLIHIVVNLLRFTAAPEQSVWNLPLPHPGYLLSSEHQLYPFAYLCHIPTLLVTQGIFLALIPVLDSHRVVHQIISDQLLNQLRGFGTGDLIGLTGIQPDHLLQSGKY